MVFVLPQIGAMLSWSRAQMSRRRSRTAPKHPLYYDRCHFLPLSRANDTARQRHVLDRSVGPGLKSVFELSEPKPQWCECRMARKEHGRRRQDRSAKDGFWRYFGYDYLAAEALQ